MPCATARPVAVVASLPAEEAAINLAAGSEANAGRATHAPSPRKNWRRLKLRKVGGCSFHGVFILRATGWPEPRSPAFLKGRGFHHASQQSGRAAIRLLQARHDFIHSFHVIIIQATTNGIR